MDIFLVSFLLTLNMICIFLLCFCCWLRTGSCLMGYCKSAIKCRLRLNATLFNHRFALASPSRKRQTYWAEVFLWKGVLKICSKFTGEHPFRSVISINMQSTFRTPFSKNTSGELLLKKPINHYSCLIKTKKVTRTITVCPKLLSLVNFRNRKTRFFCQNIVFWISAALK